MYPFSRAVWPKSDPSHPVTISIDKVEVNVPLRGVAVRGAGKLEALGGPSIHALTSCLSDICRFKPIETVPFAAEGHEEERNHERFA